MADMDEDNAYPNSGEWYGQPPARIQEEDDEQTKLSQAKPLIRDLIARLDERIVFYGTLDSISADITLEPAKYQQIVEANRVVRDTLLQERNYIMSLITEK